MTRTHDLAFSEGYQTALSDLAFKIADTRDVRDLLVWCRDNASEQLDRDRFVEALARLDAAR